MENVLELLRYLFGDQVPTWIPPTIAVVLLIGVVLGAATTAKKFWTDVIPKRSPEERRRIEKRRRFADHIEQEIRRLNTLQEWSDYRFTELEAEVEAEGRRRTFRLLPFLKRTRTGLQRERSLSKALKHSQERLILLNGDPGSGKSVALRHLTQMLAQRGMRARSAKSLIPIYINLKELERSDGATIDRNLISDFVLRSLNRPNDRDIIAFLDEEFNRGLGEGTWLFLFDSFDELPDVLSSTEADATIRSYSDAISDFLGGMNQCRGVIASRQFRGPSGAGWQRFRILPLSEARRIELIENADLKPDIGNELKAQLGGTAQQDLHIMMSNPMFLGLLCEHMRDGHSFPSNAHDIFESYVEKRLTRDAERLRRRYDLDPDQVRLAAEQVAYCMAADAGLGLSPARVTIRGAMVHVGFQVDEKFDQLLDALEYIKLALPETATSVSVSKFFTFAHRRFQEYFATRVVLREPHRATPRQLLTDARWRETAVVMCQTQPVEVLSPIIEETRTLLGSCTLLVIYPRQRTCVGRAYILWSTPCGALMPSERTIDTRQEPAYYHALC